MPQALQNKPHPFSWPDGMTGDTNQVLVSVDLVLIMSVVFSYYSLGFSVVMWL